VPEDCAESAAAAAARRAMEHNQFRGTLPSQLGALAFVYLL
jgi:hypothetical protein